MAIMINKLAEDGALKLAQDRGKDNASIEFIRFADKAVNDALDILDGAWRSTIKSRHKDERGQLLKAMKMRKAVRGRGALTFKESHYTSEKGWGGKTYKRGYPVRVAEVAFYLHYGTRNMAGSRWIEVAEEKAESAISSAIDKAFDDVFGKG